MSVFQLVVILYLFPFLDDSWFYCIPGLSKQPKINRTCCADASESTENCEFDLI